MKKIALLFVLLFGFSFAAKGNDNAIGIWAGDYNGHWGFDWKHLVGNSLAWNVYLGNFEIGDNTSIGLGFGYYYLYNIIKADPSVGRFPLHVGPNFGFGYWRGSTYDGIDLGLGIAGGISWFTPTTPEMDVSLELGSPSIGHWSQRNRQGDGSWKRNYNPGFGLKGGLGLRFLFHVYFF